jgi:hypothetical protein
MSLPDFFVIGAPKAGSTALHAALAQHPQLYLSKVKEPKFFLTDGRPTRAAQRGPGDAHSAREWVWRRDAYERLFDAAGPDQLRGESTPFYLWSTDAHRRLHAAVPDAKLIAIVRDPVDRAYSNWTHLWCDGLEPEADFLTACDLEADRIRNGWAPFWRYLEMGRYGEQLQHLYSVFDPSQVHVLRYRQLVDRPVETLDDICRFLGVDVNHLQAVREANVSTWVPDRPVNTVLRRAIRAGAALGAYAPPELWRTAERPLRAALHRGHRNRPPLDPAVRRQLTPRFADDIALLGGLTGTSYEDWLSDAGRGTYSVRKS